MGEMVGVHVIVEGKVQGVGFRAFTVTQATVKGLHGWVRNRQDGTVEVEAEGLQTVLKDFLEILKEGPRLAHVTKIVVDWKDSTRHTHGFTILPD
jgi:acylphosphatase